MPLQFIVHKVEGKIVQQVLHAIDPHIEVFTIDGLGIGISVPSKVIDRVGDEKILSALDKFDYYDLWSGKQHSSSVKGIRWVSRLLGKL